MKSELQEHPLRYLGENLSIAIGLVLIWRGLWYVLDAVDMTIFGGNHILSAVGGIILGISILYLPDHDLKALERL